MSRFAEMVNVELSKARSKHPGGMHSAHEAYSVILEEVDEFWELVKTDAITKNIPEYGSQKALAELVQIAAMCQRAVYQRSRVESAHRWFFRFYSIWKPSP